MVKYVSIVFFFICQNAFSQDLPYFKFNNLDSLRMKCSCAEDYVQWCYKIKQNSESLFKAAGLNIELFNTMLDITIVHSFEDQKESRIRKKYVRIIFYNS